MAHYSLLDENNVVVNVIKGRDEWDLPEGITSWEEHYGEFHGMRCVRTSINTRFNVRLDPETNEPTGEPGFRGNYGGIGMIFDETLGEDGVFLYPQPYPSWTMNENYRWIPPTPYPDDGQPWEWDEESLSWVLPETSTESS